MVFVAAEKARFIRVPFSEKDEAKSLGARWDAETKCWFIPQGVDPAKLSEWWAYLECPYEEKDAARKLGAKWDKAQKRWYVPSELDFDDFEQWWPGWVNERVALVSDGDERLQWHFVDGQLGGRFGFHFSEDYQKSGGTAQVFFGWPVDEDEHEMDPDDSPTVAIKNFFTDDGSLDFTMFEREVSALRGLSDHPNIVSLVDYGFDVSDRTFFVITEYHPFTLGELMSGIRSGELSILGEDIDMSDEDDDVENEETPAQTWLETFELLEGILNGLCYALETGIYHRDLKPGNVLCAYDEDADNLVMKLCDFGIATSQVSAEGGATVRSVYTEMYTPKSDDEEGYPGARDVYSLGVIAVELLSDEDLTTEAEVREALENEVKPEIPSAIGEILERCLDVDPSCRPENVKMLLGEILEANDGLAVNG